MNKQEFLDALKERLSVFPQDDISDRLSFYEEMIDDRIEEGMTEEEAVAAVDSVDEIVEDVMSEIPLSKIVTKRIKPERKLRAWEIVLLVLGSPVWVPLCLAAIIILLAVYIIIWSVAVCEYAVNVSFAAGAVFSIASAVQLLLSGNPAGAFFMLGAGMALAGLTILMFFFSAWVTRLMLKATKRFALWIKSLFIKKEMRE